MVILELQGIRDMLKAEGDASAAKLLAMPA